jgi:hypothetical protein
MRVRRGVASLALLPLILVAMLLGFGVSTASAVSLDRVTGGQSALFVPLEGVQKLAQQRIFAAPIDPAYATFTSLEEGPAVRFPISGGAVESSTMLGTVNHEGGLSIQKFSSDWTTKLAQLDVTDIKVVAGSQLVGNALGIVPAPTADLINATHSKDRATGVITYEADAQINVVTATVLNTYFSTDVFTPGMLLGHWKSTIETRSIL